MSGLAGEPPPGEAMRRLIDDLYPITRSITGDGVRATLERIGEEIPLRRSEVASGTAVLDWTVPSEWNIREGWIATVDGERVVDFADCNLHVMSYSTPVEARLSRAELDSHLFSLPDRPEWIPYRTSYYEEAWGFCLSENVRRQLTDETYDVRIDSSFDEQGALSYGECLLEGESADEVLISCHVCHPSLCNDNLSGIAIATDLARELARQPHRLTYRFLFIPGTIGSITWLARNERALASIRAGLVLTCVGDGGDSTYKRSRRGDAEVDRAMEHVLASSGSGYAIEDFFPYGYDERQYCSPGFDLPVGCLMRTPHGRFPEYHTSADDRDFIRTDALVDSREKVRSMFGILERNGKPLSTHPKGEPQLGRRGLYRAVGGMLDRRGAEMAMLWVLNQADGSHDLLDIAVRSGLPFETVADAADLLADHDLLEPIFKEP